MKTSMTVCVVAVMGLSGVSASGQSVVQYTLALGGNNHAEEYEAGVGFPRFSPGDLADGQYFVFGDVITWEVRVRVFGTPAGGVPTNGAANLVFNLLLYAEGETTPLDLGRAVLVKSRPITGGWFSSIHDGDADGVRGQQLGPDSLEVAAFTSIFDIQGNGFLGGHVFDLTTQGGPGLAQRSYPSCFGFPDGSMAPPGALYGMGAGYRDFNPATGLEVGGVGLMEVGGGGCPGLGELPLFEGQISTVGLAAGNYVLKIEDVLPGHYSGDNYLLGTIDCSKPNLGAFARRADVVLGDTIIFTLGPRTMAADLDGDNDVDSMDLQLFKNCLTGPGIQFVPGSLPSECPVDPVTGVLLIDFDQDGDVDQSDFGIAQACSTGSGKTPPAGC